MVWLRGLVLGSRTLEVFLKAENRHVKAIYNIQFNKQAKDYVTFNNYIYIYITYIYLHTINIYAHVYIRISLFLH